RIVVAAPPSQWGTARILLVSTAYRDYALRMLQSRMRAVLRVMCLLWLSASCTNNVSTSTSSPNDTIDRDLLDVTVPQLRKLYADKKYTVAQVVQWHLARIDRYNSVYGAIEQLFRSEALAEAARQDGDTRGAHGPLWGVPIVIKANTSIKGYVTTAGWEGFAKK